MNYLISISYIYVSSTSKIIVKKIETSNGRRFFCQERHSVPQRAFPDRSVVKFVAVGNGCATDGSFSIKSCPPRLNARIRNQ